MHTIPVCTLDAQTIRRFNAMQLRLVWPIIHPYTCPHRGDGSYHGEEGGNKGVLIATHEGLICPYCGYAQDWIYASSLAGRNELEQAPKAAKDIATSLLGDIDSRLIEAIERYQQMFLDIDKGYFGSALTKKRRQSAVYAMLQCLYELRLASC